MAFAKSEQVMDCIEALIQKLWAQMLAVDVGALPFPRLSYQKAMTTYGSDKPDTRLGMEVRNIQMVYNFATD